MASILFLIVFALFTVISSLIIFLTRKLMRAVLFLSFAAVGSALLFFYLNQNLVALLQLLVFVGGLSTYLIVAVATEEKSPSMESLPEFFAAAVIITLGLGIFVYAIPGTQFVQNGFSGVAQSAFTTYYPLLFASLFLLFAGAIGSILVIKKFSRMVV